MMDTKSSPRKRIASWLFRMRGNERAIDRAKFLVDSGNRDETLRFLDYSSEVFENCSKLKCEASTFLFRLREFPMAVEWLRRGGIAELEEETVFQWSAEIESSGDLPLAIELLKIHLDRTDHPTDHDPSEIHYRIARLYRILGDTESTVEHVSLCLETGNYPNVLSIVCSLNGEKERRLLLDQVGRFKTAADKTGHYAARLNFAISDIYKHNGDYQNSAIHLGKARDENAAASGTATKDGKQLKPSFLIIGTMKSGTTTFYYTLCQHPQVHAATRKEVRYFGDPRATNDWYFAHFPKVPHGQHGITGEATPNYYALDIQDQIKHTLPGVKLICLMRDPAERAISQYFHGWRHGAIKRPIEKFFDQKTLDRLAAKPERELNEIAFRAGQGDLTYPPTIAFGMYVHYLRKWYQKFDPDRFLLLTLDEFSNQQSRTIDRTCDFLGIDRAEPLELKKPHRGIYDADDKNVQQVYQRLKDFYEVPNKKLFEEFGIQFGS